MAPAMRRGQGLVGIAQFMKQSFKTDQSLHPEVTTRVGFESSIEST